MREALTELSSQVLLHDRYRPLRPLVGELVEAIIADERWPPEVVRASGGLTDAAADERHAVNERLTQATEAFVAEIAVIPDRDLLRPAMAMIETYCTHWLEEWGAVADDPAGSHRRPWRIPMDGPYAWDTAPVEIRAAEADDGPIGATALAEEWGVISLHTDGYFRWVPVAGLPAPELTQTERHDGHWSVTAEGVIQAPIVGDNTEWIETRLQGTGQVDLTGLSLAEINALLNEVLEPEGPHG